MDPWLLLMPFVWPDREADGWDAPVAKKKDSRVLSGRGGGESSLSSLSGAHKITVTHSSHTPVHTAENCAIGKGARRTARSPAADRDRPESKPSCTCSEFQIPRSGFGESDMTSASLRTHCLNRVEGTVGVLNCTEIISIL